MGQMPATILHWPVRNAIFGRLFILVLGLPMYYILPIVLDLQVSDELYFYVLYYGKSGH